MAIVQTNPGSRIVIYHSDGTVFELNYVYDIRMTTIHDRDSFPRIELYASSSEGIYRLPAGQAISEDQVNALQGRLDAGLVSNEITKNRVIRIPDAEDDLCE